MATQGVGAALSPAIGGWMAQQFGYAAMFPTLGAFAMLSVVLWLKFRTELVAAETIRE
ncbi:MULTISPECIES: hypothetical protein [unclassified Hyphomicrobium]|uniref:hypothetical protein n=1 Tax=unclassified Hyphomicrobium TaxID=2619925 RepID=UPI000213EB88|nr:MULTISPECIES: hypothetical protein [unclassified Hyphomicrobium]CCB67206.1 protein of unknown function [Hyphomicrobium sp. MC1]